MKASVTYCGVRLDCQFDYDASEPATRWHPGSPANAALESCKAGGIELMEMLTREQQDEIETKLAEVMEEGAAESYATRRDERLMEMQYP